MVINYCRRRGCLKCKRRHHTSICERNNCPARAKTLLAIILVKFNRTTLKAYFDTGSGRTFISLKAIKGFC